MLLFFMDLRRPKINTRTIRSFQINMTHTYIHTDNTDHILSSLFFTSEIFHMHSQVEKKKLH